MSKIRFIAVKILIEAYPGASKSVDDKSDGKPESGISKELANKTDDEGWIVNF